MKYNLDRRRYNRLNFRHYSTTTIFDTVMYIISHCTLYTDLKIPSWKRRFNRNHFVVVVNKIDDDIIIQRYTRSERHKHIHECEINLLSSISEALKHAKPTNTTLLINSLSIHGWFIVTLYFKRIWVNLICIKLNELFLQFFLLLQCRILYCLDFLMSNFSLQIIS